MIARLTRRKGSSLLVMVMIYSLSLPMNALAMPQGGQVVSGQAEISQTNPQTMNIHQGTPKAILNWQQFSIAKPEAVHFMQPNAAAVALNRVVGVDPSTIHGLLSANGRIFLINPNGVLVGPTGRIETAGFVASTLDMANQDFLNGNYTFVQDPAQPLGSILNKGLIEAAGGGNVSLIAPGIENQGTILANLGTVSLGAGEQVTLAFAGNEMIRFAIAAPVTGQVIGPDGEPMEDTLLNSGTISADGGEVILSARSAFDAVKSVVNNTGVIESTTLEEENGIIRLDGGDQGIVYNSGTLDVSGTDDGETGGEVRVTGEKVGLVHYSEILARGRTGGGKVLIGGDYQGNNPDVPNAKRTYVGSDSVINADALDSGDGGKVIVWSDEATRFYGDISARGGAEGGDGGFAEVSGKQNLSFDGTVNLGSTNGAAGTLLLDPFNVVIQDGGTTGVSGDGSLANPFTSDNVSDLLTTASINSALSTATVKVITGAGVGEDGDISISGTITAPNNSNDLILEAHNNITLTGTIDFNTNTSSGDVALRADFLGSDGAGQIIDNGGSINMGSGALQLSAGSGIGASEAGNQIEVQNLGDFAATTGTGGIFINNTGSGDINITSVTVPTDAGTPGTDITVTGVSATTGSIEITNAAGSITVPNNGIVTPDNLVLSAATTINAAAVDGTAEIDVDGDVTLTGTQIGGGSRLDITGDGISDSTLTVVSTAITGENVEIDVLTNQFSAISLTMPDADSSALIELPGVDVIDVDTVDSSNLSVTSVVTTNTDANVFFDSTQASAGVTIPAGAVDLGGDAAFSSAGQLALGVGGTSIFADDALTGVALLADGAITNDNDSTIAFGSTGGALILSAVSGVGSLAHPILISGDTVDVDLAGETGTGGIFVTGQGGGTLNVTEQTNIIFGTITGLSTSTSGDISLSNAGSITVDEAVRTADATTDGVASGDITLSTTSGDISINADVTTGTADVTEAGPGTAAQSGQIQVSAGGTGTISGTGTLITSSATVTDADGDDTATVGNITLSADKVSRTAGGAQTDQFAITFGTPSSFGGTDAFGTLSVTTDCGAGSSGGAFFQASSGDIVLANGGINTGSGDLSLAASAGSINAQLPGDDTVEITASGNVFLEGQAIGGTNQLELGGDDSGDSSLTINVISTTNVDLDVRDQQFNDIQATLANADSSMDITQNNVGDAFTDTIDIDGAAGTSTINTVTTTNTNAALTVTLNETDSDIVVNSATITAGAAVELSSVDDITVGSGAGTAIEASGGAYNVTLIADNDGDDTGAILDGGGSINMSGGGQLLLLAGSGIGPSGAGSAIETVGLGDVAAETNTGGIFLNNTGSGNINITTLGATTGLQTLISGDIELTNAAGSITVPNSGIVTTGNLVLSAATTINALADDVGAELEVDGNVKMTGTEIGGGGRLDLSGDGSGDSILTVINTGTAVENVNIEVLTNQFNGISLALADAKSSALIELPGVDVIDIDTASNTELEVASVNTSNLGADLSFVSNQTGATLTILDGAVVLGGDVAFSSAGNLRLDPAGGIPITASGSNYGVALLADDAILNTNSGTIAFGSTGGRLVLSASSGVGSTVDPILLTGDTLPVSLSAQTDTGGSLLAGRVVQPLM